MSTGYSTGFEAAKTSQVQRQSTRKATEQLIKNSVVFQPLRPSGVPVIQELTFQFQSTQFTQINAVGNARIYANSAPSAIDEETLASVAAYARFDDVGGSGTASPSPFPGGGGGASAESFTTTSYTETSFTSVSIITAGGTGILYRVPMEDNEAKTAFYHGDYNFIRWSAYFHPDVAHTKQFMLSNSVQLNVPGTNSDDTSAFCYYASNTAFNVSASISTSLWFYPTDLDALGGETWRTLLYRRIDASNHFAVVIKPSDSKVYVFVNEAGTTTKLVSTAAANQDAWNLIIFTYDPAANALIIYLNNSSSSSTPADTYTPPYTTDANVYIGGLPTFPAKRFTGYMDNFVFWTGKILSAGEADNMWNRGTII